MSSALRDLKLIELCAPSIDYDAQVKAASTAFDNQMYEIIDATGVVRFIPNIMGLTDSNLVDILAWQFHVDFYDPRKSLEFRKRLVQLSIQWHITKGTYQLVQDVLDVYWPGGASLLEWFDYYDPLPPGKPPDPPGPPPVPPESPIIVPPPPGGSWHDRYRFRIYIDETIIDPADEAAVLTLIEHYKPISRWCEGIFRATVADCFIGWTGAMLRFVIRESEEPNNRTQAEFYYFESPVESSGAVLVYSDTFTVILPTLSTVDAVVTVTPSDGEGGTFTPATAKLSNLNPEAKFVYKPSSAGAKTITVTNDGGLTDPPPLAYQAKAIAETYSLTGPASGYTGAASTAFAVALPMNTITPEPVTITPNDGGAGGTFTPASVQLDAPTLRTWLEKSGTTSATFIYTPNAVAGTKMISCTNDGGLTDPPALSYNAVEFTPAAVAGLAQWCNGDSIQQPTAYNWWDYSPNARHWAMWLVNPTRFVGPNGHYAVHFGGENYGGYLNQSPTWFTGPYTVFLVIRHETVPVPLGMWFSLGSFGTPAARIYCNGADIVFNQGAANATDAGGIVAGEWNVITAQWDGTNIRLWRNGILKATTPVATLGPQEPRYSLAYDSPAGNYYFIVGDLADEAVYAAAIPDADRLALEGYFKNRYNTP